MAAVNNPSSLDHITLAASIPIPQIPLFLKNKLHPLLPYSLPLYRRCQFFLHERRLQSQQDKTSNSQSDSSDKLETGDPELWVALSVPKGTFETGSENSWVTKWLDSPRSVSSSTATSSDSDPDPQHAVQSSNQDGQQEEWLACHINVKESGQTGIWAFGSWEANSFLTSEISSSLEPKIATPTESQCDLGRALFRHLRTQHIPALSIEPSLQYRTMKEAGMIVSTPYKRTKILFGALAETSLWVLGDECVGRHSTSTSHVNLTKNGGGVEVAKRAGRTSITRENGPYLKYILNLPLPTVSLQQSTTNYQSSVLSTKHLQTMLDRSEIPRSLELLKELVAVGLFPPNHSDPVSWGVLSKDASLSSLHTENEWRGKGLAELVVRELVKSTSHRYQSVVEGDALEEDGVMYTHTDVSVSNLPSRRVFEKLGAKIGWRVWWVEVDVGEESEES